MDALFKVDWQKAFALDTSVLEIFIRGTVVYLALFFMLRMLRRLVGTVGISDLLVLVVIADAAQNAMAGTYNSVTDGVLLVATIIFWSVVLDWVAYRFPRLRPLVRAKPLLLVKDGQLLHDNLDRELMCEDELRGELRLEGVDTFAKVKTAYVESDGRVSVVQRDEKPTGLRERPGGQV